MSFWLNVKRVSRYGVAGFVRNAFVSLAAVLIMSITLFVIGTLMISSAALNATLALLSDQVDVTVYFLPDAPEQDVLDMQRSLSALPEVAQVTYVSREQALADFRERHGNDQAILSAVDELGRNPLGAALEIRAKDTSQYEAIARFMLAQQEGGTGAGASIDSINFYQNKTAIDRLTNIIETSRRVGIVAALLLGFASLVIALNTIRLAIYTARDEIGVMNLVGAGRWYVRGPFMVAGVLYGVVSGVVVLLLMYPIMYWLGPKSEAFLGNFNVFEYFTTMFPLIFLVIMGAGIALGALSSYLAVRRYLRM